MPSKVSDLDCVKEIFNKAQKKRQNE